MAARSMSVSANAWRNSCPRRTRRKSSSRVAARRAGMRRTRRATSDWSIARSAASARNCWSSQRRSARCVLAMVCMRGRMRVSAIRRRGRKAAGAVGGFQVGLGERAADGFHEAGLEEDAERGDGLARVDVHGVGLAVVEHQEGIAVHQHFAAAGLPRHRARGHALDGERAGEILDDVPAAPRPQDCVTNAQGRRWPVERQRHGYECTWRSPCYAGSNG